MTRPDLDEIDGLAEAAILGPLANDADRGRGPLPVPPPLVTWGEFAIAMERFGRMKTTTIYLVMGDGGEYDTRAQWPVRAYTTRAAAEAECSRLAALFEALLVPTAEDARKAEERARDGRPWWSARSEAGCRAVSEMNERPDGDPHVNDHVVSWDVHEVALVTEDA
jgi:hypothetical protein